MPRRNAIVRRPAFGLARRANYGGGIVRAITKAANSAAVKTLTRNARAAGVKPAWRRKLLSENTRRRTTAGGPTMDAIGGGNDWTMSRSKVGYRKKPNLARLARLMEVGMQKSIFRFQGLTNFDTNTGFFKIPNWQYSTGEVQIPVHVYDLSCFPNINAAQAAYQFQWASTASTANIIRFPLEGQTSTGTASANWNVENGPPNTTFPNARVMRHDWTDVRINFYGPRKRTSKYEVLFVRVKDEFANPLIAAQANAALKELFAYLERPCVYSNLQMYQTNVAKKIQVVKRFTYWVSASQSTDVDTAVGKIKEARIFLRHDKVYNLDWRQEGDGTATVSHVQADGANYVTDTAHHNTPWHGSRLMMIIRAFAPERRTGIVYPGTADANIDPTYDLLIRNAVSTPN